MEMNAIKGGVRRGGIDVLWQMSSILTSFFTASHEGYQKAKQVQANPENFY